MAEQERDLDLEAIRGQVNAFLDARPIGATILIPQKAELGLVLMDCLQLMRGSTRTDSREQEISKISPSLKALTKELDVPVIALSQLNRKVEECADKRPVLSELRESGPIEQDVDLIIFLYRDEV